MFEKPQKRESQLTEKGISKRAFFTGLGASALVVGLGAKKYAEYDPTNSHSVLTPSSEEPTSVVEEVQVHESSTEEKREFTNSTWFNADAEKYAEQYKLELPYVLPLASLPTKGDIQERSRMKYIAEALQIDGVPETVQTELKRLFQALAVVESRYDENAVSEDGARSILQILEIVWNEHAKPGMDPWSLTDQVYVVGKYLSQLHQHLHNQCGQALEAIKNSFFDGDVEAFEKEFVTPVLINGFFSGMGTMATLVNWFSKTYKIKEDTREEIGQSGILTGYDVYFMLSRTAFHQVPVQRYKEKGMDYALLVYGARKMLDDNLDPVQKELLLGQV